ncbi:hypothetical protein LIER_30032 [Lithospermum erythrorhizon]|uniref:Aminotransferase-like plant mobile domain-containing protein n=1 Tax=Lithospermum erythrorhizon TaxID=34254 RepID=A0AAV3RS49_LITER
MGIRCFGRTVRVNSGIDPVLLELICPNGMKGENVKLDRLWELGKDPLLTTPRHRASCYLAYLLGCTLCVNKSSDCIHAAYVALFNDITEASDFSWRSGTLAFLYHQLGMTSRVEVKQISRCFTLLEVIYLSWHGYRMESGAPRARRWSNITLTKRDPQSTIMYQKQLDRLTANDVRWTPYGPIPDDSMSYYHGCICFLGFNKAYMPDRVTRQFGYVQRIQAICIKPDIVVLSLSPRSYMKIYGNYDTMWARQTMHRFRPEEFGPLVVDTHEDAHPNDDHVVDPPATFSSPGGRWSRVVRECIAETLCHSFMTRTVILLIM